MRPYIGWLCCCMAWGPCITAQEAIGLADLNSAEYAALERTSEASVAATISFLAADELAGRGTPSPELDIASRYVASRLRAAGAEGLGPQGSYFLTSEIDVVQVPRHGSKLVCGGTDARVSLVRGSEGSEGNPGQPITYSGNETLRWDASRTGDKLPEGFSAPVILPWNTDLGPPGSRAFNSEARRLASGGAIAILVEVAEDSPWWSYAESNQERPRIDSPRGRLGAPILVVASGAIIDGQPISLSIPPNTKAKAQVRNVAGILRGSDPELAHQAILFTAHLDHLGSGAPGSDPIFNGADDDASGVTAVLTLADSFGALRPHAKRSLIFMTFWGEESGLLGSKQFVSDPAWPLQDIVANINIEMIGRPEAGAENKCWMTGWTESDLGSLFSQGSRRLGVETFEHPKYSSQLYRASDNFSFVQKGVVAHSFSAGSLHEDYHQPSDEWQKLNLPHMTQVIRGLYAGALPLAQGKWTPQSR